MGLFGKGSTRRTGEAKSSKSSFSSSSSSSSFPVDNCRNATIPPSSSSMSLEAGSTRLARSGADPRSTSSSSSSGSTRTPSGPPPSSRRAPPTPTIQTSWGVEEFGRENTQTWKRTLEGVRQETVTPASHSSASSAAAATGVGAVGSSSTSPIGARGAPIQLRFNERDSARARMSIVSSPRSSVYASPMASPLSAKSEARGRFDGEGGTGFVARPPRRESLMIDTRNFVLPLPSPKRLSVNAVASGLIIPDSPSNFFDPNLPASPVSLASPPPQTASMAYNSSPGNYYHGASPSPSPSRNSSNSLLGGMGPSSPRLSPSLFATKSRNDHGSPDTTVSSIKVGTSSISSHDARPPPAIGKSGMAQPGANSNVTRLQELSINSPEATGRRSNGSRDNSPLGHAKAQQDGALRRTSSISSHDQSHHARPLPAIAGTSGMSRPGADSNVTRLQELSINSPEATGQRSNGSRDNSPLGHAKAQQDGALKHLNEPRQQPDYEGSPSRQPVLSSPSTPMKIPSLQTRRLTRAAPDDPFAAGGPVRSVSQNNPRAQALAAARERNTSSSGHSDAGSPSPVLSPRLTIRTPGGSTFEKAVAAFPAQVLRRILAVTKYDDFRALRATSRALRRSMDEPLAKEFVLQRYLGPWGYRSYALGSDKTPTSFSSSATTEPIVLTLRDLDAFLIATEIQIEQYARFAKEYSLDRLHATTLRIIRASTRAWNRVVLRLRWQLEGYGGKGCWAPYAFEGQTVAHNLAVVFRSGRAPTLRTWVPLSGTTSWMADSEVVECEREIWRSGVWGEMRRGDVVVNTAIAPFGNLGKLIFDGKFLRDFGYRYDVVGHLPNWLGMLSFSPQYYHNIVAASTASPVFYLWLQKFAAQAHESLVLCEDKVHVTSPQRGYMVKRFMYRVSIQVRANEAILDISAPKPQIVHPDWVGTIMIEIEGTTEHRRFAMEKIASPYPTPWRILREKSRPGKLWIRPVSDQDAV